MDTGEAEVFLPSVASWSLPTDLTERDGSPHTEISVMSTTCSASCREPLIRASELRKSLDRSQRALRLIRGSLGRTTDSAILPKTGSVPNGTTAVSNPDDHRRGVAHEPHQPT